MVKKSINLEVVELEHKIAPGVIGSVLAGISGASTGNIVNEGLIGSVKAGMMDEGTTLNLANMGHIAKLDTHTIGLSTTNIYNSGTMIDVDLFSNWQKLDTGEMVRGASTNLLNDGYIHDLDAMTRHGSTTTIVNNSLINDAYLVDTKDLTIVDNNGIFNKMELYGFRQGQFIIDNADGVIGKLDMTLTERSIADILN